MTLASLLRAPATERVVLVLLTLAIVALRVRLAVSDGGATLFFDEAYYIENARAMFALGPYSTAHYPPLYSLLLVPGLAVDSWYSATMAISAAASALTVPAGWFLARSVGLRAPLLAALAIGMLTSAFAYATFLMSENLSTPIFVVAVALAVRARAREGWVLGVAAAALVLTKYLFLPVAVILLVGHLVLRHRAEPHRPAGARAREIGLVFAGPVVGATLWLVYSLGSGMTLFQSVGLTDPSSTFERSVAEGDAGGLVLWIAVYLAALILPALPTVFLGIAFLSRRRAAGARLDRTQRALAVLTAVVAATAVAVAVQHSFGAPYNYPEPQLAWPRYLVHLGPIAIVVGLVLLQSLTSTATRAVRIPVVLAALAATGGVAGLSWWFLFREGSGIIAWGFTAPITAADLFPFRSAGTFALALAICGVVAAILVVPVARRRAVALGALALTALLAVPTFGYLDRAVPSDSYLGDTSDVGGATMRKMIDVIADDAVRDPSTVFVLGDGVAIARPYWQLRFWDLGPDEIQTPTFDELGLEFPVRDATATAEFLASIRALAGCSAPGDVCYLVTRTPLPVPGRTDERWGETLVFTRVP